MLFSTMPGILALSAQTKYENGAFNSEFTAGGDTLALPRLAVTDKVMDQSDKSLNRKLWELYPVDKKLDEIKKLGQTAMMAQVMGGMSGDKSVAELLPLHDEDQRMQLFIIIYGVCTVLEAKPGSISADLFGGPSKRKRGNVVEPLATLIARVQAQKEEANIILRSAENNKHPFQGQTEALLAYLRALLELTPWLASPLVFTSKQAFETGIAPLQAALLLNTAIACQYLGANVPALYRKAMQFASLVIEMRYVKHATLMKAIRILNSSRISLCNETMESPGDMPRIVKGVLERMERKSKDGWAHANCLTEEHEGCM